jgi:hypothetical protein
MRIRKKECQTLIIFGPRGGAGQGLEGRTVSLSMSSILVVELLARTCQSGCYDVFFFSFVPHVL